MILYVEFGYINKFEGLLFVVKPLACTNRRVVNMLQYCLRLELQLVRTSSHRLSQQGKHEYEHWAG